MKNNDIIVDLIDTIEDAPTLPTTWSGANEAGTVAANKGLMPYDSPYPAGSELDDAWRTGLTVACDYDARTELAYRD